WLLGSTRDWPRPPGLLAMVGPEMAPHQLHMALSVPVYPVPASLSISRPATALPWMWLSMTVTLLLLPAAPMVLSTRTPRVWPLSMMLWAIVMPLLPSKTATCEPRDPVIVLPVIDELVVLKKRAPFPMLVKVLLETVMFDWVFPSPAMLT